jgi:tetratricopeptide (TPR) repeat protein
MSNRWIVLALAAAVAPGCGPSEEAQKAAAAEARKAEWAAIEQDKSALDAQRQELETARAAAAEPAADEAAAEAAQAALAKGEADVMAAADALYQRVTGFINADPPVEGEPLTAQQLAAFRMKSAEDMVIAREYIERGGDYRRAIEIYQAALAVDPDNQELQAALAEAEADRFMTLERLALVKSGMSEDEVVAVVGRPLTRNVREYPEKKVTAWFYPTDEAGNAAGVFFQIKGDKKVVYEINPEAVKAAGAGGGEEEEGS